MKVASVAMDTEPRRRFTAIVITSLAVMLVSVWIVACFLQARQRAMEATEQSRQDEARRARDWLNEQLSGLRSGQQSSVYFYCTSDTDDLLRHFRDMPQVERLDFELTDIGQKGLKIVRTFPNLRELVLYGGRPGVDDVGFGELRGHQTLETLELVNTQVTDSGLDVLKTLPRLKHLTLYRGHFRNRTLTDCAVELLQGTKQLETLELSGGWISAEAVRKLKDSLPNCTISTKGNWG